VSTPLHNSLLPHIICLQGGLAEAERVVSSIASMDTVVLTAKLGVAAAAAKSALGFLQAVPGLLYAVGALALLSLGARLLRRTSRGDAAAAKDGRQQTRTGDPVASKAGTPATTGTTQAMLCLPACPMSWLLRVVPDRASVRHWSAAGNRAAEVFADDAALDMLMWDDAPVVEANESTSGVLHCIDDRVELGTAAGAWLLIVHAPEQGAGSCCNTLTCLYCLSARCR
jgi:hypothetical protein